MSWNEREGRELRVESGELRVELGYGVCCTPVGARHAAPVTMFTPYIYHPIRNVSSAWQAIPATRHAGAPRRAPTTVQQNTVILREHVHNLHVSEIKGELIWLTGHSTSVRSN